MAAPAIDRPAAHGTDNRRARPVRTAGNGPGLTGSSIGMKIVVAITGLGWIGFVVAHMIGNLKLFLGPEGGKYGKIPALDVYSEYLRDLAVPILPRTVLLWLLRTGLIVMFFGHVALVTYLAKRNRDSRPVRYAKAAHVQANRASLMMKWGGATLFVFIFFHLAQFTWGVTPDIAYHRGSTYNNLTQAFYHRPWMGALYTVAMVALAGHIYHGFWSTMQTLGFNRARFDKPFKYMARGLAGIVFAGNMAIIIGATLVVHPGF